MGMLILFVLLLLVGGAAGGLGVLVYYSKQRERALSAALQRYSGIVDAEAYAAEARAQAQAYVAEARARAHADLAGARAQAQRATADAAAKVHAGHQKATQLHGYSQEMERHIQERQAQLALLDERLELQQHGVYEPQFDFDDPEEYQDAIKEARADQKDLVKQKEAASGGDGWTVDGSLAKGRQMVDRQKKLMLRAFNGESDAAIAKVKHGNVEAMIKRVDRSAQAINKLGDRLRVWITEEYVELRVEELRLVHERQERLQDIKEEQREIREQMKEEQRAEKERQKAIREAENEAGRQEAALEKARAELAGASAAKQARWEEKIAKLEAALEATKKRKSQAELTRLGHVYVISNLGSFGEGVYKIGMTRRLEPLDRVRELGDASVPFKFDVHAMIVAEDAPALENALHKHFDARRMNKVNRRREFFRVTLDEIEAAVITLSRSRVELVRTHAAQEYRDTVAMEAQVRPQLAVEQPRPPPPPPPPRMS